MLIDFIDGNIIYTDATRIRIYIAYIANSAQHIRGIAHGAVCISYIYERRKKS